MNEYSVIYDKIKDIQFKALELEEDAEYTRFSRYPQYQFEWLMMVTNLHDKILFDSSLRQFETQIRNQLKQCRFRIGRGADPSDEFQGFLLTILSIMKQGVSDEAVN